MSSSGSGLETKTSTTILTPTHRSLKRASALQYFLVSDARSDLDTNIHIRSFWLHQQHHHSRLPMKGVIGSLPEPGLERVLGFSTRRLSHKEMCMSLAESSIRHNNDDLHDCLLSKHNYDPLYMLISLCLVFTWHYWKRNVIEKHTIACSCMFCFLESKYISLRNCFLT